jgi:hypothetical protein
LQNHHEQGGAIWTRRAQSAASEEGPSPAIDNHRSDSRPGHGPSDDDVDAFIWASMLQPIALAWREVHDAVDLQRSTMAAFFAIETVLATMLAGLFAEPTPRPLSTKLRKQAVRFGTFLSMGVLGDLVDADAQLPRAADLSAIDLALAVARVRFVALWAPVDAARCQQKSAASGSDGVPYDLRAHHERAPVMSRNQR